MREREWEKQNERKREKERDPEDCNSSLPAQDGKLCSNTS